MKELRRSDMTASSKRNAIYSIRLLALVEGFAVETKRGSGEKVTGPEIYWRQSEEEAQVLYNAILRKKTKLGRTRTYRIATAVEKQLALFRE